MATRRQDRIWNFYDKFWNLDSIDAGYEDIKLKWVWRLGVFYVLIEIMQELQRLNRKRD